MKFYQKRGFACVVLVLAILASSAWGIYKKPASLPHVTSHQWICDNAKLLSGDTKKTIESYNNNWNGSYRAVVAAATVKSIKGWDDEDFAAQLGTDWGLGTNDMLLLMVEGDDYYVACGDSVLDTMTDTQQTKLQGAIEEYYYKGAYDQAAVAFYRQVDVFYAQMFSGSNYGGGGNALWEEPLSAPSHVNYTGVVVMLIAFFVVWILLDRMRYNRYRRRYMGPTVVRPVVTYYPIFWGRALRPARPVPPRPPRSSYGGGYAAPRPSQHRPITTSRPAAPRRPGGTPRSGGMPRGSGRGGFGGNGFGGKRR